MMLMTVRPQILSNRSLERTLEDAHLSGVLCLSGRKLKEFPSIGKYNLVDTVAADLSRNRFSEFPVEITEFWCLEHLNLYRNVIRSIPNNVTCLQSLVYLDLSRNQLNVLPTTLCQLPLQILLLSHNKLQNIPSELGLCKTLWELDISCNQLTHLPPQLGQLTLLRYLNVRSNLLLELPLELTYLRLSHLDVSQNRIATLPVELRNMVSLELLHVADNPLVAPPAAVCTRGRIHIFKWLELRCTKEDRQRTNNVKNSNKKSQRNYSDLNLHTYSQQLDNGSNAQSVVNIDPHNKYKLGQGVNEFSIPKLGRSNSEREISGNKNSTKSSPMNKNVFGDFSSKLMNAMPNEKKPLHVETYKEYKESLRQQRHHDQIYKAQNVTSQPVNVNNQQICIEEPSTAYTESSGFVQKNSPVTTDGKNQLSFATQNTKESSTPYIEPLHSGQNPPSVITGKNQFSYTSQNMKEHSVVHTEPQKSVQKSPPSITTGKNQFSFGSQSVNPPSASHTESSHSVQKNFSTVSAGKNQYPFANQNVQSPSPANPITVSKTTQFNLPKNEDPTKFQVGKDAWHNNNNEQSQKLQFTIRREFVRAREEAELIEHLRASIESRLKMVLPENLSAAFKDGVVLCHLANYIQPCSVPSIHVPSPTVPKLTIGKCRRNVENFLEACRKIGVEEKCICHSQDILEEKGLISVAVTVSRLLEFHNQTIDPARTSITRIS